MKFWRSFVGKLCAAGLVLASASCDNQIPTASGGDLFPGGLRPVTVELMLNAEQFLVADTAFDGFTRAFEAGYLLVANRFGAAAPGPALQAHSLIRFTRFPDSVTFAQGGVQRSDTSFTYASAQLVLSRDTAQSRAAEAVTLRVYALEQAWDAATATWFLAADTAGARVPWRQPGGTLGDLLAETTLLPGDSLTRDSVVWQLDSVAVNRLVRRGFPGIAITATGGPSRVQLRTPRLRALVRPAARPDTAVSVSVLTSTSTFVFTPEPPRQPGTLTVGGISGARTVFLLQVPREVPGCSTAGGQTCAAVRLRDVALNQAALVLDPVAVPLAFRPFAPVELSLRRVLEPELGVQAPLGGLLASDSIPAERFAAGGAPVELELTRFVQSAAADTVPTTLALLLEPEGRTFGVAQFRRQPRLRLVYTLPRRLLLP